MNECEYEKGSQNMDQPKKTWKRKVLEKPVLLYTLPKISVEVNIFLLVCVIRRECGQTWTRVRVKYYNY